MKKIFFLLTISIFFYACTENDTNELESPNQKVEKSDQKDTGSNKRCYFC